ncbi:MAG: protease pro-enzyme activation domain-containing protein, partial [Opitutales bacterium]
MFRFAQGLRPGSPIRCAWPHFLLLVATLLLSAPLLRAQTTAADRTAFPGSIKPVAPSAPTAQIKRSRPTITRTALSAVENAAPMQVEVAFSLRNFAQLRDALDQGHRISPADLATHYLPLPADYDRVASWLTGRGLKITRRDPSRLALFVQGSVRQITDTFQVSFARVALNGREYTSAISAPSVPTTLASPILGINGLQPHLRMTPHARLAAPATPNSTTANGPPFIPSQIALAYNASGLSQTGSNQTIAIVIDTFPSTTDLTAFWSACNVPQSLSNIDLIQVVNGTLPSPDLECSLDTEWTSSLAPAAKIRVYATLDLELTDLDLAYEQIISDLPTQPNLHQVSLSYGGAETEFPDTELATDSQFFAILAASGVTVCVSSGDGGSNPNSDGDYDSSVTPSPEAPASDPSVTSVGGTSLTVDQTTGNVTSETAWSGSGGGISFFFPRPAWQTGPGVPAGTTRLVPDVASDAPLGYLNPLLYPQNGSANFRDITSSSNGDYSAGPGYDLVTGLGVPVVSNLLNLLTSEPAIVTPPSGTEVIFNTNATYSVTAAGAGPLSYQWQLLPVGSSTWSNLADSATYSGSATANLTVANATTAMSGDQFQCVVTNPFGNVTTFPLAVLVVDVPFVVSTFAGQTGNTGTLNGVGAAAQFNLPIGLVSDSGGNIYVADTYNQLIRKISPAANVTTLAGTANVTGSSNGSG